MKIGIISDTHGLLRPEVFRVFAGVDHILHAGDLGSLDLLVELEAIAPVTVVWGNTDGVAVRSQVPETGRVTLGGVEAVVVHGHQFGSPTPRAVAKAHERAGLAIFGHTHQPVIEQVGEVLVINPGSAGPRRFQLPVTSVVATIRDGGIDPRLVQLVREER